MRRLTLTVLLLALAVGSGCVSSGTAFTPVATGTGTIRYMNLEGGFYLIVSDDGTRYDPLGLDPAFQREGLRVRYVVRPRPGGVTVHMVGTTVDVLQIEAIAGP